MDNKKLQEVHDQIVSLYKNSLLPIIRKYFDNEENSATEKVSVDYANTLVTQADLAINEVLLEKLPVIVPGAKVVSEESDDRTIAEYTFIIDPIDGTHSFARNLDDFGISIALLGAGIPLYSVIFYPNSKTEYYYAIRGNGAFDNTGKRINAKPVFMFKPTFICAPSSRKVGRALIDYAKGKMLSFRAYGSCVYAFYSILRGGTDFLVFHKLNIWDIAGCLVIAEEAGLTVKWFGDAPVYDNSVDITKVKYTVCIYKPDMEKGLLSALMSEVEGNYEG
jgi:fructose-1,6-bisphosphatase/inositol monophosphatase family enzyme